MGTRISGSIRRLPGKSVRTIKNASIPPSGMAMATSADKAAFERLIEIRVGEDKFE